MHQILVLNLGGTSTKVAVYRDEICLAEKTLRHGPKDMSAHPTSREQVIYRSKMIASWLQELGLSIDDIDALACRGCYIREAKQSGTYLMNDVLKERTLEIYFPDKPPVHGIPLILPVALKLLDGRKRPIYVTDPTSVDEKLPEACLSGTPAIVRLGRFHPLNQKAVARKVAASLGKKYEECRFVVAHLGAGISVGAHQYGRVIDVNDVGLGDGPFTPERAGSVPNGQLMDICFSGQYTRDEVFKMLRGQGGVMGYLGTNNMQEVEERITRGDEKAALVFQAMALQISKEIGACCATLKGNVDAIIITGGIAHSQRMTHAITSYVGSFAPIKIIPGEFENEALALGALRVLRGEIRPIIFE
ncbi:MAG: butyrate kinase [Clostridiales bacterium]|nr:butyrate kinase [Clostridiales bacterium]